MVDDRNEDLNRFHSNEVLGLDGPITRASPDHYEPGDPLFFISGEGDIPFSLLCFVTRSQKALTRVRDADMNSTKGVSSAINRAAFESWVEHNAEAVWVSISEIQGNL